MTVSVTLLATEMRKLLRDATPRLASAAKTIR